MTMKPQQTCERCGWTCDDAGTFAAEGLCHVCITAPPSPTASNFMGVLSGAGQHARDVIEDIEHAFSVMPTDIAIGVGIDLVGALTHVRTAQRLIAHAADAQAVKR